MTSALFSITQAPPTNPSAPKLRLGEWMRAHSPNPIRAARAIPAAIGAKTLSEFGLHLRSGKLCERAYAISGQKFFLKKAIQEYEKMIRHAENKDRYALHVGIAGCFEKLGNLEEAARAHHHASESAPDEQAKLPHLTAAIHLYAKQSEALEKAGFTEKTHELISRATHIFVNPAVKAWFNAAEPLLEASLQAKKRELIDEIIAAEGPITSRHFYDGNLVECRAQVLIAEELLAANKPKKAGDAYLLAISNAPEGTKTGALFRLASVCYCKEAERIFENKNGITDDLLIMLSFAHAFAKGERKEKLLEKIKLLLGAQQEGQKIFWGWKNSNSV